MDYRTWREYGYRSLLGLIKCGGGPSTQAVSNTAGQQTALATQEQTQATANQAEALALEQPLITQQTALATGDRSSALAASMPTISTITGGFNASKEQIMNNVAPGPARDAALANLETNRATTTANTQAGMIENAPTTLANLGSGMGAFSMQQLGAALSGYSGASNSEQSVMNVQEQQQAAKMGVAGSVLGAAGTAAGGIFEGKSDRRLKQKIVPVRPTLDLLDGMPVFEFEYIAEPGFSRIGVIAQNALNVFPEAVKADASGMWVVDYAQLAAVALAAVRELHLKVEDLEGRMRVYEEEAALAKE